MLVPLCFGLYSLWLGADANWDLLNYHLYNPFAWLNGKLALDFAPAGMNSYFNPLLDSLFYLGVTHLPPRIVGFAMGTLHGLNFVLLLAIVRCVLPDLPERDRYRVPLLLALAGALTANFLSVIGNSMGDATTALFSLAGLLVLLKNWGDLSSRSMRGIGAALVGGGLVGLGVGLKLTNVTYAVAFCLALLFSYPGRASTKLWVSVLFGIGTLIGFAITGGYWFAYMWKLFGNPLYPQFGALFPNPLTKPSTVTDLRWLPRGFWENVLWPIIISLNSTRAGEDRIHQVLWAVVYVLILWWGADCIFRRRASSGTAMDSRARMLVLAVAIGFVVWMRLFSIYRYIIPIELLTPVVIWMLLNRLASYEIARRNAARILVVGTAIVLAGGASTWGHNGWAEPLYRAEVPAIAESNRATVFLVPTRGEPLGWLATQFPPDVAFMGLENNFPGTDLYRTRMLQAARLRNGPVYAIVDGVQDWRADSAARASRVIDSLGLTSSARGCALLHKIVSRLHIHASVNDLTTSTHRCELGVRADDAVDVEKENRRNLDSAQRIAQRTGFDIDLATCVRHRMWVGTGESIYQWCQVSMR
ncbi:glycosyltransferase 87 family protein [Burkholderia diffusa]|uniref:glycosyltransferase 87 family protein n=1 Tax=Burkholderia diffusa TaxID=488732 RepID=UPI001E535CD5|nr:glycosyltransferase 87 family protein [Burkholderia diffusa]